MVYLPCKERLKKSIFCQIKLQQSFNYIAPIFGVAIVTAACKRKPVFASTMTKNTTASLLKMWMLNETNILAVIKQKNIVFKQTGRLGNTMLRKYTTKYVHKFQKPHSIASTGRPRSPQTAITNFIHIYKYYFEL